MSSKNIDLDKDILNLTLDIAEESTKNHHTLIEQGVIIDSLKSKEDQINNNLKTSSVYLSKINSYANMITKYFSKDYYHKPVISENRDTIENRKDSDYQFTDDIKKNLEIIKNIQLNISNELDDQIDALKYHSNKISQLDSNVKNLHSRIRFLD